MRGRATATADGIVPLRPLSLVLEGSEGGGGGVGSGTASLEPSPSHAPRESMAPPLRPKSRKLRLITLL